ncbi:MAG TPA: YdiU family protein [Pseudomonadales bacterium]|nr:YdiU family protein [Pseudomonadales bacterium]
MRLDQLRFNNTFYALGPDFYSESQTQGLLNPQLISANASVAELIGLDPHDMYSPSFLQCFSGNQPLSGMQPLAMVYAGHQFGSYVPRLGDGRAILLGEVSSQDHNWDLVLKGAGSTRYSRNGDGRAVLRSSIREYLCSEAMAALGIPTTRALCLIGGDNQVIRERIETAAIVTRVAPSHVRFGSFEYFSHSGQTEHSLRLLDYVISQHFSHLQDQADKYPRFFAEVTRLTAQLIAQWQAVGFSHGVMNTDNMSIIGLTLDYGPFGFMDAFNPEYICNHSDVTGRYAFNQQAQVGLWNCHALALALSPFIEKEALVESLQRYENTFVQHYYRLMTQKLGFLDFLPEDASYIEQLLALMTTHKVDYSRFFRALCTVSENDLASCQALTETFHHDPAFDRWLSLYFSRLHLESNKPQLDRELRMKQVNPKYILRNHLLQIAIDKAEKEQDYSEVNLLLHLIKKPFDEHPDKESYAALPPEWSQHLVISCSS